MEAHDEVDEIGEADGVHVVGEMDEMDGVDETGVLDEDELVGAWEVLVAAVAVAVMREEEESGEALADSAA